jgi:hypothetical protein
MDFVYVLPQAWYFLSGHGLIKMSLVYDKNAIANVLRIKTNQKRILAS